MKNRKRLFALLLSAALMLSVTACGGKSGGSDASAGSSPAAPGASAPAGEQIAEELIVLVGADASTFDPHFCTDSATEIFNKNMYNGLVKFNSDMEILPDLAKDWSVSEDGLTWTFNLPRRYQVQRRGGQGLSGSYPQPGRGLPRAHLPAAHRHRGSGQ